MIETSESLSPREYILLENDRDEARLVREYNAHLKELELDVLREKNTGDVALAQLQAKWSSWLQIPITIVRLPVYILLSIAVILLSIRNREPSARMLDFLKK